MQSIGGLLAQNMAPASQVMKSVPGVSYQALDGNKKVVKGFVGASSWVYTPASPIFKVQWPAGTMEGDTAVIAVSYSAVADTVMTASGFVRLYNLEIYATSGQYLTVWYKLALSIDDISNPPSVNTGNYGNRTVCVYRSVSAVTGLGSVQTTTSSVAQSVSGLSATDVILSILCSRDTPAAATTPAGFNFRTSSLNETYFPIWDADKLGFNGSYSWTNITTGFGAICASIKITVA